MEILEDAGVPKDLLRFNGAKFKEYLNNENKSVKNATLSRWIREVKEGEKYYCYYTEMKRIVVTPLIIYDSGGTRVDGISLARIAACLIARHLGLLKIECRPFKFKWFSLEYILSTYEYGDFNRIRDLEEDLDLVHVAIFDSIYHTEISPKRKQALADILSKRLIEKKRKDIIIIQTPISNIKKDFPPSVMDALNLCRRIIIADKEKEGGVNS